MPKALKIVFMGTPTFAVPTLESLHNSRHEVVAVVTSLDKYGGRGRKTLIESAVKKFAVEHKIPVLQPKNLKADDFNEELKSYNADIQVVVAFRMLPVKVWDMPPHGTINLHGSLLPQFRGAAPINWAVINGEKVTGLTTFKIKHAIDTGDMIHQVKVRIEDNDTAGTIHDKLMMEGGPLMLKTLEDIAADQVDYILQDESLVSKAPKIYRETCEINFHQEAQKVHDHIRGLSPYPGAWFSHSEKMEIKVLKAEIDPTTTNLKPGELSSDNKTFIKIGTTDKAINILELQLTGKKRMDTKSLLNGFNF